MNETLLEILEEVRVQSPDPNTKIGAIIFDQDLDGKYHVVSTGYNAYPGTMEELSWDRSHTGGSTFTKYPYVIHAEMSAVVNAHTDVSAMSMLCTTSPCNECMKVILQAGIKKLYIVNDQHNGTEFNLQGKLMMKYSDIEVIKLYEQE